jgi:outer membrane protein assembly factor BamD (BamD/ComL family)
MTRRFFPLFSLLRGWAALAVAFAALAGACASGPPDIPEELSAEELIQRGQEAADRNRYGQSLYYYQAIMDRFPSNLDMVCTAEYEIAFIHYKQKKYEEARGEFEALLLRYAGPDGANLPPQFKRLSELVLQKIGEKAL